MTARVVAVEHKAIFTVKFVEPHYTMLHGKAVEIDALRITISRADRPWQIDAWLNSEGREHPMRLPIEQLHPIDRAHCRARMIEAMSDDAVRMIR